MKDIPERALTISSVHLEALSGRGVLLHDLQRYENAFNDSITRIFCIRPPTTLRSSRADRGETLFHRINPNLLPVVLHGKAHRPAFHNR